MSRNSAISGYRVERGGIALTSDLLDAWIAITASRDGAEAQIIETKFIDEAREQRITPLPPSDLQKRVGGTSGFLQHGWNLFRNVRGCVKPHRRLLGYVRGGQQDYVVLRRRPRDRSRTA